MTTSLRPLGAQVLIRVPKATESIKHGIIVPDSARKDGPVEGIVEAVGTGRRDPSGTLIPFDVTVGDKVLFARYGGTEVKVADVQYTLVTEENIYAIIS